MISIDKFRFVNGAGTRFIFNIFDSSQCVKLNRFFKKTNREIKYKMFATFTHKQWAVTHHSIRAIILRNTAAEVTSSFYSGRFLIIINLRLIIHAFKGLSRKVQKVT